jgi:YgiT-type zinc finger domain-containing protein
MERELRERMAAWRKLHPQASLDEIETELDRQIALLRVAVLGETIATSKAVSGAAEAVCPECGAPMERSGRRKRKLQTYGGVTLQLEREYVRCPRCGRGFFPSGPGA